MQTRLFAFLAIYPDRGAHASRVLAMASSTSRTLLEMRTGLGVASTWKACCSETRQPARETRALPRFSRRACFLAFLTSARLAFGYEELAPASTPAPDKSQYTLFNPTPIDLRRAYNTDRPSKTDSPFTIDAGVFQIYVNTRTSGPGFGKPVANDGFGDTTVRLKINLLGNDGGKLVIGLVSSLKIPTNTGHTGNHVWEPGFGLPMNYSLPWGLTLFAQTRIDILDKPRSSNMRVQWQNPIGLSRTIVGNLSGYVEFYDAVSTGRHQPWIGTFDTGLIYQVTPNFSVDVDSFFGLTRSAPDYNVFVGFGRRF
jgi:hypothetical protein